MVTHTDAPLRSSSSWEWWAMLGLGIVAAALGAYGLRQYELDHLDDSDGWSVAYHTLQLFLLHAPHLEHAIRWPLHVGRWLAAVVVLAAVVKGLTRVFRSECRLLWTKRHGGHVVICGLGRLGMQLAHEFRRNGKRVVAIETRDRPDNSARARDLGVAVVTGDACNPADLRRAAVIDAEQVIAVCGDEQTNVAVAAAVGELRSQSPRRRAGRAALECWIFVADTRLRRLFQRDQLFPRTGPDYRVNVRGLDLFAVAARQILDRSPLDFGGIAPTDPTVVHLVIVGFGSMGQRLALQAAMTGHFANAKKLKLTVVERKGRSHLEEFLGWHGKLAEICDVVPATIDVEAVDAAAQLVKLADLPGDAPHRTTIALCWDEHNKPANSESEVLQNLRHDDRINLGLAVDVVKASPARDIPILVFQTRRAGLGGLFPETGRGEAIGMRMHAFGMFEDTCSLDSLLHESDDVIARALHKHYYTTQVDEGHAPGSKPALYPWDELEPSFKDSNRQAADHIAVKLRAIGYHKDRLQDDRFGLESIQLLGAPTVEMLAKMEHQRWCAELWLQGFVHGPGKRNDLAKTHPCLLSWDELDGGTQEWDRQQVRAIPEALRLAGFGIYPRP